MTLSFSTHWRNGTANFFIEKIWRSFMLSLTEEEIKTKTRYYNFASKLNCISYKKVFSVAPKLHTLREDKKDRWKAGKKIHPVIHNRTPNRFQFAPTMECKSVQIVKIQNLFILDDNIRRVYLDNSPYPFYDLSSKRGFVAKLHYQRMLQFVKNDGFDDIDSFFNFFFPNGEEGTKNLKLIHWTDLKY